METFNFLSEIAAPRKIQSQKVQSFQIMKIFFDKLNNKALFSRIFKIGICVFQK